MVIFIISAGHAAAFSTARAESITIACYDDYRPYSYINNKGETVGVLIDLWKLWGKKNQIDLTFVPGSLTQCLDRVKEKKADIMIGLFRSDQRSLFLDFSNPIMDIQTNLYVRQDMKIDSIHDIGDTVVGVIENDFVLEYLSENHPGIRTKSFSGSAEVVKKALAGNISAYALDFPNAIFLLAEHDSLTKFRLLQTLYTEKLRAGVSKGNTELISVINKGVKSLSKQDKEDIYKKWGIAPPHLIVKYRFWIIGIVALLLAGCVGFALYSIKLKSRLKGLASGNRPFDKEDWLLLIARGENDWVEFKSSLRWSYRTEKLDKKLESVILKTISAFMNARGGTLFIGVNDEGQLLGIEYDYKTFQKKPNADGFMLKLSDMISINLGRQSHKFISTDIQTIEDLDICRITVRPGEKPVFVKEKGIENFYIRAGASSIPLSMGEFYEYIYTRWKRSA